jgi:hypothetical protein
MARVWLQGYFNRGGLSARVRIASPLILRDGHCQSTGHPLEIYWKTIVTMAPLFSLPNELRISALCSRFPCREQQIRSLATLLSVSISSPIARDLCQLTVN